MKKCCVMGDTLNALMRDPATVSFYTTYQVALVDDMKEFAHLDQNKELDLEPGRNGEWERGEQGADEDVEMAKPVPVEAVA